MGKGQGSDRRTNLPLVQQDASGSQRAGAVSAPGAGLRIVDAFIAEPPRHVWGPPHERRPDFDDEEMSDWRCTRCHAWFTLTLARDALIHTHYQPRPGFKRPSRRYVPCNLDRDDVPPVTLNDGTLKDLVRAGGWQGCCLPNTDEFREFRSAAVCRMYNLVDPNEHPAATGYVPASF